MFMDEQRYAIWNQLRQHGIRAFSKQLTPEVFADAAKRSNVRLAKSPLHLGNLVWLGVAAALHATCSFAFVLTMTLKALEDQQHFSQTNLGKAKKNGGKRKKKKRSKHSPHRDDPTQTSEEAWAKARRRMPLSFWAELIVLLADKFQTQHQSKVMFRDFRLLAADGTRVDLPNWPALRKYFGAAKNKGGQHNAQARLVMLQFPSVRLPYRYELSPLGIGEISLLLRMVPQLRRNDLTLLDAGYWSYGLFWAVQRQQAYFAIRLRRGVQLKTLRSLGKEDRLVRWSPKDSRGNWRKQELPASIDLRAISYRVPGFRRQTIITNVLDAKRISREDWTRLTTDCESGRNLAPGLYHRRWQIETTYNELKVVQGLDRDLRSRTPESIAYEVAGHVVLYLLVRWLIVEAAAKHSIDPLRISFENALNELKLMQGALITATPCWAASTLIPRLLDRVASHYVEWRPGRHYPRKKKRSTQSKTARKAASKSRKKG
jgi:Transposase DDE domain